MTHILPPRRGFIDISLLTVRLVAETGEVVGELLDDVGGVAGRVLLAVVADDDGLRRLGDADAGPAL